MISSRNKSLVDGHRHTTWLLVAMCHVVVSVAWTPDSMPRIDLIGYDIRQPQFFSNTSNNFFTILDQDARTILIGARNHVYNLSLADLTERRDRRIEWQSSDAHRELCILKGRPETECQNFIRVYGRNSPAEFTLCGTNSYKPLCRRYAFRDEASAEEGSGSSSNEINPVSGPTRLEVGADTEAQGRCAYSPQHNSSYAFVGGHLFSATVADFSGADPLIYREPQRTEQYDLMQLNQPAFVRVIEHGAHVLVFFREVAMEHMNQGKAVYSRVARVCRDDRGGPHRFADRWTSFQKTRLNCSVPGDYPFYFDEIQATSDIVQGLYTAAATSRTRDAIIYAVFTTSVNAIPGSAVCAFAASDIMAAFDAGPFKAQRDSTSNWLPVPAEDVPQPRPGSCAVDSRTLPQMSVNFAKTHPLMDQAAPPLFGRPILTHVHLRHRLTAIAVDSQVPVLGAAARANVRSVDVMFVGTDDGRVMKVASFVLGGDGSQHTVTVSQTQALPNGVAVLEMTVAPEADRLIVVGAGGRIVGLPLQGRFETVGNCSACLSQLDPHWVWDIVNQRCRTVASVLRESREVKPRDFLQVVLGHKRYVNTIEQLCQRHPRSRAFDDVDIRPANRQAPILDQDETTLIGLGGSESIGDDDLRATSGRRHVQVVTLVDPMHQPLETGRNDDGLMTLANGSVISLMCILFLAGLGMGVLLTRLRNGRRNGCIGCGGIGAGIGDEPSPYTTHSNHIHAFDPSCEKQHLNSMYLNRGCPSTTTTTSLVSTPTGDSSSTKDLTKEINLYMDAAAAAAAASNNNSSSNNLSDKYPAITQQPHQHQSTVAAAHHRLPSTLSIISEKHLADQLELELSIKDRSHECNNSTERLDKEVAVSRMSLGSLGDFTSEIEKMADKMAAAASAATDKTTVVDDGASMTGTLQKVKKTYI